MLDLKCRKKIQILNGGIFLSINSALLKIFIEGNDKTQINLAKSMGLSSSRFSEKLNEQNGGEFTQEEIAFIAKRYKLSYRDLNFLFFNRNVS